MDGNNNTITKYEYKSLIYSTRFRNATDTNAFDKLINDSAGNGWEFVTATSLATSMWNYGITNGILLTFRRESQ